MLHITLKRTVRGCIQSHIKTVGLFFAMNTEGCKFMLFAVSEAHRRNNNMYKYPYMYRYTLKPTLSRHKTLPFYPNLAGNKIYTILCQKSAIETQ